LFYANPQYGLGPGGNGVEKKLFHIPPHAIIAHFLRDAQLIFLFAAALLRAQAEF
jgi:hypothetical protein